jgi:hypothetical protein
MLNVFMQDVIHQIIGLPLFYMLDLAHPAVHQFQAFPSACEVGCEG